MEIYSGGALIPPATSSKRNIDMGNGHFHTVTQHYFRKSDAGCSRLGARATVLLLPHVPTNISVVLGLCSPEYSTLSPTQSILPTADTGEAKLGIILNFFCRLNKRKRERRFVLATRISTIEMDGAWSRVGMRNV
jgi:hypothetical protein